MLSIRTSAHDFGLIHPLENAGFRLMDNGMVAIYHKSVYFEYLKKGLTLRDYQDGDLPAILQIIADAYEDDRFHNDPRISHEKAEALYAAWITKSCTDPGKDEHVMVAEFDGKVAGFFEYQPVHNLSEVTGIHVHSCGLAAVRRDRLGLGIYHSMLSNAIKTFVELGSPYGMTRIPFSIQPILKLTLRLGPSFLVNDLTFHLWID
jgi:L-amino acid N-acyltransferase YncA